MKRKPIYRYERLKAEMSERGPLSAVRWAVLVVAAVMGILGFVNLRSGTDDCRQAIVKLKEQYDMRLRELENLQVQQEELTCARYIRDAVRDMNLALRQAVPGQVRRMAVAVRQPQTSRRGEATLVAQVE